MSMRRLHIRVYGRVHGVGFRYSCQLRAEKLCVRGWVRNCRDGTVEACLEGPDEALSRMHEWLLDGPSLAHVDHVDVEEVNPSEPLTGFVVLPNE